MTSELGCISFIILAVTMITSSAVRASSLIARYTIWRRALCSCGSMRSIYAHQSTERGTNVRTSLCWNNFVVPKNSVVASCVLNVSPT